MQNQGDPSEHSKERKKHKNQGGSSELSKNLRKMREKAGLSQAQLAEMVKVSQKSISAYENDTPISSDILCRVAKVLDCSTDYLLGLDTKRRRIWQFETLADVVSVLECLEHLGLIAYHEEDLDDEDGSSYVGCFRIDNIKLTEQYFHSRKAIYKLEGTISDKEFNNILEAWKDGARKRLKDLSEWKYRDEIGCFCKAIPAEFKTIESDDPNQVIKGFRLEIDDSHKRRAAHDAVHAILHPEESEET